MKKISLALVGIKNLLKTLKDDDELFFVQLNTVGRMEEKKV